MASKGKESALTLPQLFSQLKLCGEDGDHERGLIVANKILEQVPDDKDAFQCKVVSLLQLSEFKEALKVINGNQALSSDLLLEKAYCLYRLQQLPEALETLKSLKTRDNAANELLAQIYYRLEMYRKSFGVYQELIRNCQDDYVEEREANLVASACLATINNEDVAPVELRSTSYELCYNSACQLAAGGKLSEAERLLVRGQELCRESLLDEDPDMTANEIEAELGLARAQLGYVYQLQGKNSEALSLYNSVIKTRRDDQSLTAVASNNIVTIKKDRDVFESRKRLKAATADGLEQKLSRHQRRAIAFNRCLFALTQRQSEQCRTAIASLEKDHPTSDLPCLLRAAQLQQEKHPGKAYHLLQEYASTHPDSAVRVQLSLAQIQLTQGEISNAVVTLEAIQPLRYRLAMVKTLVALYAHLGRTEKAIEFLQQACDYHEAAQSDGSSSHEQLLLLMQYSANYLLEIGEPRLAANILDKLRRLDSSKVGTLAQLVLAYSRFDPSKAEQLSQILPNFSSDEQLDVDSLEMLSGLPRSRRARVAEQKAEGAAAGTSAEVAEKKKPKKKRKVRYPKNYDPDIPPDPERWLPRWERSYNQKRRHKKKGPQVGKGTQGTAMPSGAFEGLDQSSPDTRPSPKPSGASPASASGAATAPASSGASSTTAKKKPQSHRKKKGKW